MEQMRLQFNSHEQKLQFKFVGNNFDDSHLHFMNGDEQYFQAQYCYHSVSVWIHPIPFIFSRMAISLMPAPGLARKH